VSRGDRGADAAVSEVGRVEVRGVADRLLAYEIAPSPPLEHADAVDTELLERALMLVRFSPRNQPRETVEKLLSPNDPEHGRRAVDALIEAALVTQDEHGRLRRDGAPRPHLLLAARRSPRAARPASGREPLSTKAYPEPRAVVRGEATFAQAAAEDGRYRPSDAQLARAGGAIPNVAGFL
jgi:hypothetical protein